MFWYICFLHSQLHKQHMHTCVHIHVHCSCMHIHAHTHTRNAYVSSVQFSTTFTLEYRFEEIQNLQFAVYDIDDKHHVDNIDKQQLIGTTECTLAEIMAAGEHLTKSLRLNGMCIVHLRVCTYFCMSIYMYSMCVCRYCNCTCTCVPSIV